MAKSKKYVISREVYKYPYCAKFDDTEDNLSDKVCRGTIKIRKKIVRKTKRTFVYIQLILSLGKVGFILLSFSELFGPKSLWDPDPDPNPIIYERNFSYSTDTKQQNDTNGEHITVNIEMATGVLTLTREVSPNMVEFNNNMAPKRFSSSKRRS